MAGIAVVGANSLALSPILTDVAADLGAAPVEAARAVAAYGGATALSALWLGPLVDRLGPARALRAAMALLALAMAGSALAPHWLALAAAQATAGLGAGVALPATYALATALAPPGQEARALGRVLLGWSVSMTAGVPAAALVADAAGWRVGFLALGVLAALMALAAGRFPGGDAQEGGVRARAGGVRAALGVPGVPALLLVCLALMTAFYGVYAFLGEHLRAALGLSASAAGAAVLAYGVGFGVAGVADGLVDRLGPRRLFPIPLASGALAYLLMPLAGDLASALALCAAWGFANHFSLNILVLLLSGANPALRGSVLGVNGAVTYLGALLGAAGLGEVYARLGFAALSWSAAALALGAALVAACLASPRGAGGARERDTTAAR